MQLPQKLLDTDNFKLRIFHLSNLNKFNHFISVSAYVTKGLKFVVQIRKKKINLLLTVKAISVMVD